MPIWLRNFTFNSIKEHFDKQNEETQEHSKSPDKSKSILGPDVNPTYSTKASNK